MAHWIKKFAAKPDDQPESDSWDPHVVKNQLLQIVL